MLDDDLFEGGYCLGLTKMVTGVTIFLSLIAYLLMGFIWGLWHPGWIVFFAIPVLPSLAAAINERNPHKFLYFFLVTAVYLLVGFLKGVWHPTWVMFLTVPIYSIIASFINKM